MLKEAIILKKLFSEFVQPLGDRMSMVGKNVDGFSLFIFLEALEPPTRLVMENNVLLARVHKTRD